MKRFAFAVSLAALGAFAVLFAQAPAGDALFKAMHDEMDRATKLTLANLTPALEIALKWAETNKVRVWQTVDGVTSQLPNGGPKRDQGT